MYQPPRKGFLSYFFPFFLILLFIVGGFSLLNTFINNGTFEQAQKLQVKAETEGVEIVLNAKNNTKTKAPVDKMYGIYNGELLQTNTTGSAKLFLASPSYIYTFPQSSLQLNKTVVDMDSSYQNIDITMKRGKIYAKIDRILNRKSRIVLRYENIEITTKKADILFQPGLIQVLSGKAEVTAVQKNQQSITVGVGQQVKFNIKNAKVFEEITALPNEIYQSADVLLAQGKQATEESDAPVDTTTTPPTTETTIVTSDTTKEIILDIESGAEITKEPFILTGTVPAGTKTVEVNNYTLSKFKEGDTTFTYRASRDWKNLSSGENTFTIQANGEETVTTSLDITFTPEEKTEEVIKETEEKIITADKIDKPETKTAAIIKTILAVTEPTENTNISSDPVTIRGTAPANTAKIIIGDYTLRTFKENDLYWKYTASQKYDNLTAGEKNTYIITAFDSAGTEISSINFSFTSTAKTVETE
ncbi:hypothetical protein COB57_04535 [Candidatus Peregrinibacteria bacterium]|nr:MAG: hypothetical protein COB57_05250 [Candidatus Peregrinibacteria bacterium]PCI24651.1 MAG: hypothetical protein COB57_04535 [Candidatus Peregrinibacteria bacterium]